jgi:hypothetical protein
MKITNYSKLVVSLITNAGTILATYPHVDWKQVGAAAIGSFLVWFIPNTQTTTTAQTSEVETPK